MALTASPDAGQVLREHGFGEDEGLTALRTVRGKDVFKLFRRKSIKPPSFELMNILDRTALNNLFFSSGEGKVTSLNLLHAIITSDMNGTKIGTTQFLMGPMQTPLVFDNEGVKVLKAAGVDVGKLRRDVDIKTREQYTPRQTT